MALFPRDARGRIDTAGRAGWRTLTAYVRATIVVATADAVGIGVGAALLGVPLAIPLGVLVFLGAFVPIVGALLSGSVAVLVALVALGPVQALIMLASSSRCSSWKPRDAALLLGRAVSVHPLAVVLAIGAGLIVAGIVGALFSVPWWPSATPRSTPCAAARTPDRGCADPSCAVPSSRSTCDATPSASGAGAPARTEPPAEPLAGSATMVTPSTPAPTPSAKRQLPVTLADIEAARVLLADVIRPTPLEFSRALSSRVGGEVFLKCENLQRAGSFKIRGAYTRISRLTDEERARGVVAASAGNHAQGVALAAQLLGSAPPCTCPPAPRSPRSPATRGTAPRSSSTTPSTSAWWRPAPTPSEHGSVLIHPFDHVDVVAGPGHAGLELLEQCPEVRTVLVCTGGGGLLAGVAAAIKARARTCG